MALLSLQNVSKSYEHHLILKEVALHIQEDDRIAVIGQNGSGKSTLLKIIAGTLEADSGDRITNGSLEVSYLAQKMDFVGGVSVFEYIQDSLETQRGKKEEFDTLSKDISKLSENPNSHKEGTQEFSNLKTLLAKQAKISDFLDYHNAWDLESKIQQVLDEFNLQPLQDKMINLLSGGEQKRVALASLLLHKPDILLLDEPTNHLDVQMVEFLEDMLLKERFTLVFISHDRYFVDRVATRTIEVENAKLRSFSGGYADYLRAKAEILKSLEKSHQNLLRRLKEEEEWLRGGISARRKRNMGRKERLMEMRKEAKSNPASIRKMSLELEREIKHFNQAEGTNRQKLLFELKDVSKALGNKQLINSLSMRVLAKDKLAIVGSNGSGKSTLLKMILGAIQPDSGSILKGDIQIGYFDQHREMLDDNKDLLETFCPNGGDHISFRGRSMHVFGYLKNFLFPKEFLDKKIGVLSGGEKNRVALALLLTKDYDCLVLDEPTNDLDIPTINILEEYLQSFNGAILFVSHDRYFVDKIAHKLLIFENGGKIIFSHQSFSEYLDTQKELNELHRLQKDTLTTQEKIKPQKENVIAPKKATKLSYNEKRALEILPQEIERLEQEIKDLEKLLYTTQGSSTELMEYATLLEQKQKECEKKVEEYLSLEERVGNL